jgi:Ureidoglycolate hydrolase
VHQNDESIRTTTSLPENARTLKLEPLNTEDFAPFDNLLMSNLNTTKTTNQNTTKHCDFTAKLKNTHRETHPNLTMFTSKTQTLPFALHLLEHHPYSTQTFLPLHTEHFLIYIANSLPDNNPDLTTLRTFISVTKQTINYHCNI